MFKNSSMNPKNWFLKGKDKARYHAMKHLYGESLERALVDIDHEAGSKELAIAHLELDRKYRGNSESTERSLIDITHEQGSKELAIAHLELDRKYRGMFDVDFEKKCAVIMAGQDSAETKLAFLEIDRKHKMISETDYEREKATLNKEPFVTVVKVHMNAGNPSDGFMELDWNSEFITKLVEAGYVADTQEGIIKLWFDELCGNVAKENGAIFPEKVEEFGFREAAARKVKSETGKTEIL